MAEDPSDSVAVFSLADMGFDESALLKAAEELGDDMTECGAETLPTIGADPDVILLSPAELNAGNSEDKVLTRPHIETVFQFAETPSRLNAFNDITLDSPAPPEESSVTRSSHRALRGRDRLRLREKAVKLVPKITSTALDFYWLDSSLNKTVKLDYIVQSYVQLQTEIARHTYRSRSVFVVEDNLKAFVM